MRTRAPQRSHSTTPATTTAGWACRDLRAPCALACALAWGLVLAACGGDEAPASSAAPSESSSVAAAVAAGSSALGDVFEVVGSLELEENHEVVTVRPMVAVGEPGELLVTEPLEGQVRVYGEDGRLRANAGRKGDGPGEFTLPVAAHRARDGELLVADPVQKRLTFLSSSGPDSVQVADMAGIVLVGAQDLGEDRYLLAGYRAGPGGAPGEFLHLWNRSTGETERSFLLMRVPEEMRALAMTMSAVVAVVEADTIWAAWSIPDTLYKFNTDGDRLAALPLALPRPGTANPRGGEATRDPVSMQEEFDAVTQVSNIFLLGGGEIVIQSMQTRGNDAVWDLLVMDRQGNDLWKRMDTPRLYVVANDLFYFQNPSSVHPNKWIVAKWAGEAAGGG